MTAGVETLKVIDEDETFYERLEQTSANLETGIRDSIGELGLNYTINRVGSMITLFFTDQPVTDFASAKTSDTAKFTAYFNSMLEQGVYLPPSQFEACFISAAHDASDVDRTVKAVQQSIRG
jgi:glutamate-1-semialdehyde 2,1-aminomutase